MYTTTPTVSETMVELMIAKEEIIFQFETVRRLGLSDPNTKWTVCCDTKEKTNVPKLEKCVGRKAVSK
jgi:hypothetical protein